MIRLRHFDGRELGHRRHQLVPLTTASTITTRCFHQFKPGMGFRIHGVEGYTRTLAGTVTADCYLCGSDEVITVPTLGIDSAPEKYLAALFRGVVGGKYVEKVAVTAQVFTAAHVVTASKYGAILIEVNDAGTLSTLVGETTQTTAMAYDSAALAIAALPAAGASKLAVGHIVIANNTGTWTANTDDMTNGSDLTTATFTTYAATVVSALASAVTFVAGKSVAVTCATDDANYRDATGTKSMVCVYTSDGSGALTDGALDIIWRAVPMYSDR